MITWFIPFLNMRYLSILFSLFVLFTSCKNEHSTYTLGKNSDLKIGDTVKRSLQKHKADTFHLDLDSNLLVRGHVDQINFDAVVQILDPSNKEVASFDEPARGWESYQLITKSSGMYKLVVRPFEENEGDYAMVLESAETVADNLEKRIQQIVSSSVSENKVVPGVSIAVTKEGKMIYSKGFGYADIEYDIKATPQTIYHIASVSKQFTAFSIALLVDQGKLSWDDDIRKYLPELNDFGHPITLRHLVHHTSGLRDQWNLLALAGWRLDDVITQKQIMRIVSRQKDLNFKPGDEYLYCNTGFTLMAEIVARVTGESFTNWTKKNIFDPLDMKHTFFYDDHEKVVKNRAYSYHQSNDGFKKSVLSYANAGATSLFTTVEDISLWGFNFENPKVGNTNVMKMMEEKFVLNSGDTINYALGQVVEKYKGLKIVSHGGGDAGYRTYFLRFPDQRISITVFSNSASSDPGGIAFEIADFLLKNQLKEEKKKDIPPPPEGKKDEPFDSSAKLSDFTGTFYSDELQTAYSFEVVNDTLVAKHQRHDNIKFKPARKDGFQSGTWFIGNVDFTRDKLNKINGLKVSAGRTRNIVFTKQH
jgi:CubicO group peptidase (beta-lactamase class C family)